VDLGIVDRREAPPSALFRYVPENVAARAITALSAVRRTVLDEVGRMAGLIEPQPASVIVFGSFARGEADSESDLDLVVVRDVQIAEDDDRWGSATDHFRQLVKRLTGNPVEIVETDTSQIAGLLRTRKPLWRDVRRDGVVVFGANLDDLAQEGHG
jgi:predicted nucleotidyltransferase